MQSSTSLARSGMAVLHMSKWLTLAFCAGVVIATTGCAKLQSRDQMNQGIQAYKNLHYPDAVRHFQEAVRLDPTNANAQKYLATTYMVQWIPGAESPDNKKMYDMAKLEFDRVLQKDPTDSLALASLASMAYNSASAGTPDQRHAALEEARKWNQRRIEIDAKDAEAYYYIGVIDWAEAFTPIRAGHVAAKMGLNDPGPIKDAKIREQLKEQYGKNVEDGIAALKKCLDIDKENEDAMSYMNLLLRTKADLEDTPEASKADIAQAEDWFNKSLDMKKIKASRPAKKTESS